MLWNTQPACVVPTQAGPVSLNTDPPSPSLHHHSLLAPRFTQRLADWCPRGDQLVVGSIQAHELVVRSLFYHDAPGHDGDDVGVLDRGQAVGDDDARASLPGFVQGVLHRLTWKTHKGRREPSSLPPQRLFTIIAISQPCIDYYH